MKSFLFLISLVLFINFQSRSDEGMWIPMFLGDINENQMQAMGMQITAEDIYSINQSSLKDAIMIFGGGCTGELVSDQGLLLTNHHCGFGSIQRHSSVEHDYLTDGFWARDNSEELSNPGLTVTFLVRMEEVTNRILEGITQEMTEAEREAIIKEKKEIIEKEAVEGTHYKALIKPFYYGNRYFLFINEIFEDVRLVGAPPSNIGKFGGDTDNWVWPRHTGDFSMFRIYADSNNLPAKYSEDNVPYHPKKHLSIALDGVQENDFTFIFGYPGSTQEYLPSYGIDMQVNIINPIRIGIRDKRIQIFKEFMEKSPEIRIQYAAKEAGISNGWKKWIGENRGIKRLKTIEEKQQFEANFQAWTQSSEELMASYGGLLEALEKNYKGLKPLSHDATWLREAGMGVEAIRYASAYNKLIEYAAYKDKEYEMEKRAKQLSDGMQGYFKDYQPAIDKKVFAVLMENFYNNMNQEAIPESLKKLNDKYDGNYNRMADEVFEKSVFVSQDKLLPLLENFKKSTAKKISKDPIFKLSEEFNTIYYQNYQSLIAKTYNQLDSLMRLYMQAQIDMQPFKNFYPDANFTLRVSYGQVNGFSPDDAKDYRYFTTLDGIMEKENPEIYDYVVEDKLKELYRNKDYGRYADADEQMHVCFIATNHTTGGNSGSPVLDANGNLIGINFDRCWESTMSDFVYDKSQCRNIALDIRYCLFLIDKFAGASNLVDEMTLAD